MRDIGEKDMTAKDDFTETENDGGVRLAKVALCMASCAACHQWPNAVTKIAVVASLPVALACEATRLLGKRGPGPGDSKTPFSHRQSTSCSNGGESKGSGRPRLCALRGGSSARETKDQGSQKEESQKEQENKSEQEARESYASGRTQGSEEVPTHRTSDPNGSLEASFVELETSSVRHGIWGKIQLRLSKWGRDWKRRVGLRHRLQREQEVGRVGLDCPRTTRKGSADPSLLRRFLNMRNMCQRPMPALHRGEKQQPGKVLHHGWGKTREEKLPLVVPQLWGLHRKV